MARRNKRASMREGPLSDLFKSTGADAPEDPPEAPRPGRGPRYGREDPAEAKKAEADAAPVEPSAPAPSSGPLPPASGTFFDQESEPEPKPAPRREEPVAREPEPPAPRRADPPQS